MEIKKFKDHQYPQRNNKKFSFHFITLNDSLKELDKLEPKNAIQATDISTKIIKENKNLISYYIYHIS